MNHPKNALKEAQRQSATSHHPGVRKVEKGQFKEPIGYTTQLKTLFHIHSYPSFKNLPLALISPKAKLYIKIYQNGLLNPQHLMISLPKLSPRSRCSGSMTEPPSLYAWYLGENPTKISTSTGETTPRMPPGGSKLLKDTSRWESRPQPHWTTSTPNMFAFENLVMNMGTLAWGAHIKWLKMHGNLGLFHL